MNINHCENCGVELNWLSEKWVVFSNYRCVFCKNCENTDEAKNIIKQKKDAFSEGKDPASINTVKSNSNLQVKSHKDNRVIVTDVEMSFGSMVTFMVKWVIASIPAFLLLFIIFSAASFLLALLAKLFFG